MGKAHSSCWGTQHIKQGTEHMPIFLLGLEQLLDMLLLICMQEDKCLVLVLVDAGEGLDDLGDGEDASVQTPRFLHQCDRVGVQETEEMRTGKLF